MAMVVSDHFVVAIREMKTNTMHVLACQEVCVMLRRSALDATSYDQPIHWGTSSYETCLTVARGVNNPFKNKGGHVVNALYRFDRIWHIISFGSLLYGSDSDRIRIEHNIEPDRKPGSQFAPARWLGCHSEYPGCDGLDGWWYLPDANRVYADWCNDRGYLEDAQAKVQFADWLEGK